MTWCEVKQFLKKHLSSLSVPFKMCLLLSFSATAVLTAGDILTRDSRTRTGVNNMMKDVRFGSGFRALSLCMLLHLHSLLSHC